MAGRPKIRKLRFQMIDNNFIAGPAFQPHNQPHLPPAYDYLLLKLAQRDDVRQIEVEEATFWKLQTGIDHAKEVDFSHTRIRAKGEIPSGEFGFYVASGVELTKPSGRIYDFEID
jgi:hypothetical protein